jgi:preprotein translocase subunit SecE
MNSKVETQESRMDSFKLGIAVMLLASAVIAFYYFANQSLLLRVIGLLAVAGGSLWIALQTDVGQRSLGLVLDARNEVRKVVWPSRAETVQTTLAVIIMVIIMSILLWLMDMFLGWGIQIVSGIGS